MKILIIAYLINLFIIGQILCQCRVPLSMEKCERFPVITNNDKLTNTLYPNHSNVLEVEDGQFIRIICPYSLLQINSTTHNESVAVLRCVKSTGKFTIIGSSSPMEELYDFEAFQCLNDTPIVAKKTEKDSIMTSGIQLTILHFKEMLHFRIHGGIHYEHRETLVFIRDFRPFLKSHPANNTSINYQKGLLYEKTRTNLSELFHPMNQKHELHNIIDDNGTLEKYMPEGTDNVLIETQLISDEEMYYCTEQRATHYWENVIPMWKSIREGNWALGATAIRRFATELTFGTVKLVAGTHLNLELLNSHNNRKRFLLKSNNNESIVIPVPRLIFRCIKNAEGLGIAVITVNNPFLKELSPDMLMCKPLDDCKMLYPEFKDPHRGLTYCCMVKDMGNKCNFEKRH